MAVSVSHATTSATPDSADGKISSNAWNEAHTVTGLAAIAASGSASDLIAGTVPAAQMPALTGDVTTSAGAVATTIGAGTVTLAKMASMATASVIYRKTAGSGAPEVNTLATLKTDLGLTGTNSGDQTITLTGNVTGSGTGSFATTIAAGVVTLAMQANMATASVVYRKTAGSGAPEVQTLATLKTDLGLTGTNSGDQTITLTGDVTGTGAGSFATALGANVVTYAKFQQVAASSLVGNATGSLANASGITLGATLNFSGTTLNVAKVPNAVTYNNAGSGAVSGTTFDGSAAVTLSYNTIGAGIPGHPGYIAGNWYQPIPGVSIAVGAAIPAGSIRLLPFVLERVITIQALGARVTTLSGAGNFQLAIYANNATTGRPTGTSLVHTGNISTGSATTVSAAVTANATLQPGLYWMAVNQDNSTAAYQTLAAAAAQMGALIGATTLASISNTSTTAAVELGVTQTFGTWPDLTSASFSELAGNSVSALVFMQAA